MVKLTALPGWSRNSSPDTRARWPRPLRTAIDRNRHYGAGRRTPPTNAGATGPAGPQGLKGEDIHLYARIVAVADVFDALMHKRCYKEAWPVSQVVEHLREVAGKHLDPQYVDLLIANIDEALEINRRFPD